MATFQRFSQLPREILEQKAGITGYTYEHIFMFWRDHGKFAFDPETEAIIKRSRGRRRAGSTTMRYTVRVPHGTRVNDLNGNGKDYYPIFSFMAEDDEEAIEKANRLFPKKFEKFEKQRDAGTLPELGYFVGVAR